MRQNYDQAEYGLAEIAHHPLGKKIAVKGFKKNNFRN
jgi:hypothetical protein